MGLFGKILIVLNLLIAGGFAYLAVQDWKGRQAIAAAGQRHVLLLEGEQFEGGPDTLPARVPASSDDYSDYVNTRIPFVIVGPGSEKTTSVSPEFLYAYFAQAGEAGASPFAGPTPVASQIAELKRVYGIIKSNPPNLNLGAILLRLAETFEERSDYQEWIRTNNGAELQHALDLKFHRVLASMVDSGAINPDMWGSAKSRLDQMIQQRDAALKAAADAKAAGNAAEEEKRAAEAGRLTSRIQRASPSTRVDEIDRRNQLAHLLVNLDDAASWQKRIAIILGLKQYVKAVDGQGGRFREILDRVERATVADQDRFVSEYARLRTLAIQRTQLVLEMAEVRAQLAIQLQKDQDLVNQRTAQLDELKGQRTTIINEVNTLLAKQTLVERHLFEVEREIALKLEDIYRMEAELRQVERERYGQK
jgi:hypothetical protein